MPPEHRRQNPDQCGAAAVNQYVGKASGAAGHKQLMEFVGAGIEKGQRKGGSQQLLSAQPPGAQAED